MSFKTEAFVLRAKTWREADRVYDLFTPHEGIIRAVLKSAAKPKSKIAGHMLPFAKVRVMIGRGRLDHLAGVELVYDYTNLRTDLRNLSLATAVAEIFLHSGDSAAKHTEFQLLDDIFTFLDKVEIRTDTKLILVRTFLWKYLSMSGWRPELDNCLICQKNIKTGKYMPGRGIICREHSQMGAMPVDEELIHFLKMIINGDLSVISSIKISKKLNRDWLRLSQMFYQAVYDKPSQALKLFVYG